MHLIKLMSILIEISSKSVLYVLILHVTSHKLNPCNWSFIKLFNLATLLGGFKLISYTPLQYGHVIGYIC